MSTLKNELKWAVVDLLKKSKSPFGIGFTDSEERIDLYPQSARLLPIASIREELEDFLAVHYSTDEIYQTPYFAHFLVKPSNDSLERVEVVFRNSNGYEIIFE